LFLCCFKCTRKRKEGRLEIGTQKGERKIGKRRRLEEREEEREREEEEGKRRRKKNEGNGGLGTYV